MLGQTSPVSVRFEALDALRGVCALLVVLFHIPIYHALKDVSSFANLQFCVDLFFALSGFVLCHAYGQRLNQGAEGLRFAVTRLARLWPLHLTILALFVGFELAKLIFSRADTAFELRAQAFAQGHSLWELVTNFLFLQSFGLHWGLSWNGRPGVRRSNSTSRSCSPSWCCCSRAGSTMSFSASAWRPDCCSTRFRRIRCSSPRLGHAAGLLQLLRGLPGV